MGHISHWPAGRSHRALRFGTERIVRYFSFWIYFRVCERRERRGPRVGGEILWSGRARGDCRLRARIKAERIWV